MNKVLFWAPLSAGFEDGVNPCLIMTAACMLFGLLCFKRMGINKKWILFLVAATVMGSFSFNCGVLDKLISTNHFQLFIRVTYGLLSMWIGIQGLKLLKQWLSLVKGKEIASEKNIELKTSPLVLILALSIVGFLLSMLATLWPINYYIMTFSVYMITSDESIVFGSLIFLYTVVSFWFVYMVMAAFSLEARNPRLFKVIAAAVFLSASIGVLDIIFMKG